MTFLPAPGRHPYRSAVRQRGQRGCGVPPVRRPARKQPSRLAGMAEVLSDALDGGADLPLTYDIIDQRFASCRGDRRIRRLWTGGRWLEGPVYFPAGRYLLFSDIPNDRIMRWDETTGAVGVFREPAGFTNGHTRDRQGRLVSCEQGNRRITRTEHDGAVTVLAEQHDGKRFNSPNDVVVRSDGSVWFTDPAYGADSHYEGHGAGVELDGCHLYRIDPDGTVDRVADDFQRPNGLAFSRDESLLYVADTPGRHIRVFRVQGDRLHGGEVFTDQVTGSFDGLRLDVEGRVWAATSNAVCCYAPDGELIGRIAMPEDVSNLSFGGPRNNDLFITATTSVYALRLATRGALR